MDASEAAATGAFPGDVNPADLRPDDVALPEPEAPTQRSDLRVPGGATDPLWYLAAGHLVPKNRSRTDRRNWMEGFVAACEVMRGMDDMRGIADVLRESVGLLPLPDYLD